MTLDQKELALHSKYKEMGVDPGFEVNPEDGELPFPMVKNN